MVSQALFTVHCKSGEAGLAARLPSDAHVPEGHTDGDVSRGTGVDGTTVTLPESTD